MPDITDLAAPIVERVSEALLAAGIGLFIPTLFSGEDSIVIALYDGGEVKSLETEVRKALAKARIRDAQVWWPNELPKGVEPMLPAMFPISTNTAARLDD